MLHRPSVLPGSVRRRSVSMSLIAALIAAPLALAPVSIAAADEAVAPVAAEAVVETAPVDVAAEVVAEEPAVEPAAEPAPAVEPVEAAAAPAAQPIAAPSARGPQALAATVGTPTFWVIGSDGILTFSWGFDVATYTQVAFLEIEYKDADGLWAHYAYYTPNRSTDSVPFPNHVTHEFRARSVSFANDSTEWVYSGAVMAGEVPGEPSSATLTAGVDSLTLVTGALLDEGSGDSVINVDYRATTVDNSGTWLHAVDDATQITGLSAGTEYEARVRASNPKGISVWVVSNAATPIAASVPSAPTSVTASSAIASVSINWQPPADAGSSPITGYHYDWKVSSGSTWTSLSALSTDRSKSITSFNFGQNHDLRVRAVNAAGPGPWSSVVNATPQNIMIPPFPPFPPALPPAAPTALVLTAGDGTITANWTAPAGTVSNYTVEVAATGQLTQNFTPTSTTQVITGLANSTSYTVTVKAVNAGLSSAALIDYQTPFVLAPVLTLANGQPAGSTLRAGDKVTISGVGAIPLMQIFAELHSTPIALGNTQTAGNGSYSFTVTIPKSVSPGSHSLVLFLSGDGTTIAGTTSVAVTVAAPAAVPGGTGTLAITGADPAGALWLAFVALLGGIALTVRSRRRTA